MKKKTVNKNTKILIILRINRKIIKRFGCPAFARTSRRPYAKGGINGRPTHSEKKSKLVPFPNTIENTPDLV